MGLIITPAKEPKNAFVISFLNNGNRFEIKSQRLCFIVGSLVA